MDYLNINTSQNVNIEYSVASIGGRMLAQLLDYCIFFAYFLLIYLIVSNLFEFEQTVYIIMMLPLLFYDLFFEYFYNGQSLGKRIAKIKVAKLDGTPASFGNYLIRWLFRIIDNVITFGSVSVITLIFNSRGQRLGDIAAGTTVINVSKKVTLADAMLANIPDDYTPVYAAVKQLTEKDIEIIKGVIAYYRNNVYYGNSEYADRTKDALVKKMKVTAQQTPIKFFQTILKDYAYFNK